MVLRGLSRRSTVKPKLALTVNFESNREYPCGFAGSSAPFWRLTVNRTDFCTASVPSKPVGVAIPEEKRRDLNIGFAWMAVDTWNHIINGACVGTMQDG